MVDAQEAGIDHFNVIIAHLASKGRKIVAGVNTLTPEDIITCFKVNTLGFLALLQAVIALLKNAVAPELVVVSSLSGSIKFTVAANSAVASCGVSKAGMNWIIK